MIIEVTSRNHTLTPYAHSMISGYTLQLERFFKRLYRVRWILEKGKDGLSARLDVHAQSGQYRASSPGVSVREAVHGAADLVERQRRRRKRITQKLRRAKEL